MHFGVIAPNMGAIASPESLTRIAQETEALGFDVFWVSDHLILPRELRSRYPYSSSGAFPLGPEDNILEPLTVLAYIAAQTQRVRLGVSALIIPYRNPVFTARILTTLDMLSHGRVILGAGVGWMREEFQALQANYEARGALTDEYLQVMRALWTQESPSFQGRYYKMEGIAFHPKPVQKPSIPIWIGGNTPPALRRAARLGDGWHTVRQTPEEVARSREALARYCHEHGRDAQDIEVSLRASLEITDTPPEGQRTPFTGTPEQVLEDTRRYQQVGVSHIAFAPRGRTLDQVLGHVRRFAREVLHKV
ncbi:MAG: LLM class F420-dependent oxidoreductase [Chloroflexi bacterium]|nr:LLM class F420-dependent oxidoreductase [Chloroflexota bacterium]